MDIYRQIIQRVDEGQSVVLLLVVGVVGSTPQHAGAKAVVDGQGALLAGTIGGGLMEARMADRGARALRGGTVELVEFPMHETYDREAGPICGGTMRILVLPCRPDQCEPYRQAFKAYQRRERGAILTTTNGRDVGNRCWIDAREVPGGSHPLHTHLHAVLATGKSCLAVDPKTGEEVFIEAVIPRPRMLIVGAGHVGQALVRQATWLGFEATVLDDRPDQAVAARFPPGTDVICGPIGKEVDRFPKEKDTYIVLVSKGHKPDAEALEKCIHADVAYLGMIGSGRKVTLLRQDFVASGLVTDEDFDRVFAPIGLGIGAVTVDEIATSIMAQIVAVRRGAVQTRTHST